MDQNISRLVDIVGEANVADHPQAAPSVSLATRQTLPPQPALLVRPADAEQVQMIVLWANETHTPLVPLSSGAPHFHNNALPSTHGAVMLDLSGMNRILKINRRNRLALVEPGVTYGQLLPQLRQEGLRLVLPLLPRANKSVITSLLEREPILSPKYQWNLSEPLRSLEIVWGNGDKFWSGSGINRGEKDEDWELGRAPVLGPGPGQLDFYKFVSAAQGSMGIVTWASIKCEVLPDLHRLFFVPGEKLDDLIEFIYRLLRFRLGDELFMLNNTCLASILANSPVELTALEHSLPAWTAIVGIASGQVLPEERMEAQYLDIQDLAERSGLKMTTSLPGISRAEDLLELLEHPSADVHWKQRYKGSSQDIFFLTTLDKTPGFITTMYSTAGKHRYPLTDIGVYLQPVHQGVACHCEFDLPFDREHQAEVSQVEALFHAASQELFHQKAYFSRPYGPWADMVYQADPMTRSATRKMKDIFDPNHVMNPGKLCF
ncbi:MAG: FAD-binding oxidoreductase [Acidobacteriaceae bacterium]